jgi:hypothetical protein
MEENLATGIVDNASDAVVVVLMKALLFMFLYS